MTQAVERRLKILIIEDSESDAQLIRYEIEKHGFTPELERIETAGELRRALCKTWHVIISDFRLPQLNASAVLEILHETNIETPLIIVSQAIGEDRAVELMRAGAADYVMKDSLKRLVPAIEREVREHESRRAARAREILHIDHLRLQAAAIDSAKSGIVVIDINAVDWPVIFTNRAFTVMSGYSADEAIGKNLRFLHRNDRDQAELERLRKTVHRGESGEFLLRNYKKDGSLYYSRLQISPVRNAAGDINYYIGIQNDETAKIQLEKQLRLGWERTQLALAGARLGLIDNDLQLGEIYYSSRFAEMLGYASEERFEKGPNWLYLVHPDESAHLVVARETMHSADENYLEMELRLRHKDGHWVWTHIRAKVVERSEDGSAKREIITVLDISERKMHEEEILQLTQALIDNTERERAEIAGDLHDNIGQNLVLQRLNAANFLAEHELHNVEGIATLLKPLEETLQSVREISRRLTPVHMEKIGLVPALEDLFQSVGKISKLKIEANLSGLAGFFAGDWSIQLYRIVQEALTNAVKHSGATTIRIETKRLNNSLELTLTDDGLGLTVVPQRLSIGLAMMRERARSLNGSIEWLPKNPGTTVRILLRRQVA